MGDAQPARVLPIPDKSLVLLVGASGSGKSTFAARHFPETAVLSSDYFRGLLCDDPTSQEASADAFDLLRIVADRRLARGRLTVIDATNVQEEARRPLVKLAREHDVFAVALVLNVPPEVCAERNRDRPDRRFGTRVVRGHSHSLRRSLRRLRSEGFRHVHVMKSPQEIEEVSIDVRPLWTDRPSERGPFDIIGDVHGCFDELRLLLEQMGYGVRRREAPPGWSVTPPGGRRLVFLGDLVDRGPRVPDVLRLVMDAVDDGVALCVPGNHEVKLLRKLGGKNPKMTHGLAETMEQLEREPPEFGERVRAFIDGLVSHFVLDEGRLVVAHAGMKERYQGRASGRVREFALYGETTGETDEFGLPVRHDWAKEYRGKPLVVYGHTPVLEAEWLNGTICLDTGCVFGGKLTALRYPEREVVSVPAAATYCEPVRPLEHAPGRRSAQHEHDDLLDASDVLGRRAVHCRLHGNVTVREENAAAALETMSRFAIDPRWLVHLPPTMAPCETSRQPDLLEHPGEAFGYFRGQGVERVVCEEKHMGSRALVLAARSAEAAARRFGVQDGRAGVCHTRTGRPFFGDRQGSGWPGGRCRRRSRRCREVRC